MPGWHLSEAQLDLLWPATGTDDSSVARGRIILVISFHLFDGLRMIREGCRQMEGLRKSLASLLPIHLNARLEICLERCDRCARALNFDKMIKL